MNWSISKGSPISGMRPLAWSLGAVVATVATPFRAPGLITHRVPPERIERHLLLPSACRGMTRRGRAAGPSLHRPRWSRSGGTLTACSKRTRRPTRNHWVQEPEQAVWLHLPWPPHSGPCRERVESKRLLDIHRGQTDDLSRIMPPKNRRRRSSARLAHSRNSLSSSRAGPNGHRSGAWVVLWLLMVNRLA